MSNHRIDDGASPLGRGAVCSTGVCRPVLLLGTRRAVGEPHPLQDSENLKSSIAKDGSPLVWTSLMMLESEMQFLIETDR